MTVAQRIAYTLGILSIGFAAGVYSRPAVAPVAVVQAATVTDAGGNVLTPDEFKQLMALQAASNARSEAVYAAAQAADQAYDQKVLDKYYVQLMTKAVQDASIGVIRHAPHTILKARMSSNAQGI